MRYYHYHGAIKSATAIKKIATDGFCGLQGPNAYAHAHAAIGHGGTEEQEAFQQPGGAVGRLGCHVALTCNAVQGGARRERSTPEFKRYVDLRRSGGEEGASSQLTCVAAGATKNRKVSLCGVLTAGD